MSETLISIGNYEMPELGISIENGTVEYWVGDILTTAEVFRDVALAIQAMAAHEIYSAIGKINWDHLGDVIENTEVT